MKLSPPTLRPCAPSVKPVRAPATGHDAAAPPRGRRRRSRSSALARFDFTWFIPAVVKSRRLLAEVPLAPLVLQLVGLVTLAIMWLGDIS
ncbi:hypothetical protein [Derxia lacustris]|uniref:hypothetical protein n=1 Tax=Derxia lacustris TaxID=764842 RepID=UPI00111C38B4|nr:hypothetical protein [Derxia lacustris]